MKRAIIDSRPWLLLSLLAGISYYFAMNLQIGELFLMLWKGAAVGFLAIYALRRVKSFDGKLIAAVMAFGAIGDMAIMFDLQLGAVAFVAGHIIAIYLYSRHRREKTSFSQKLFASLLIPATVLIAWMLVAEPSEKLPIAIYSLFLSAMAAMAWTSGFPRYRVGIGAILFVISDLFIFSRMGVLRASPIPDWIIWPTYYAGQFMIATGVVQTLRKNAGIQA